jgi:hypothetical protein
MNGGTRPYLALPRPLQKWPALAGEMHVRNNSASLHCRFPRKLIREWPVIGSNKRLSSCCDDEMCKRRISSDTLLPELAVLLILALGITTRIFLFARELPLVGRLFFILLLLWACVEILGYENGASPMSQGLSPGLFLVPEHAEVGGKHMPIASFRIALPVSRQ